MSDHANSSEREEPIDTDRLLAKTMRFLSVALPVIVSVAAIVNVILYAFAKNILGVEGLCLVVSLFVARDLIDHVVLILAAVLVAMSAFPSLLSLFR